LRSTELLLKEPAEFFVLSGTVNPNREAAMRAKLNDKVAVITGATSGMALATAKLFVEEEAFVFITGRRQKPLDDACGRLAGTSSACRVTRVTSPTSTDCSRR
jgi:hypothetical protein